MGAGIGVWPRAWRVLCSLGLGDELSRIAVVPPTNQPRTYPTGAHPLICFLTYIYRSPEVAFHFRKGDQPEGVNFYTLSTPGAHRSSVFMRAARYLVFHLATKEASSLSTEPNFTPSSSDTSARAAKSTPANGSSRTRNRAPDSRVSGSTSRTAPTRRATCSSAPTASSLPFGVAWSRSSHRARGPRADTRTRRRCWRQARQSGAGRSRTGQCSPQTGSVDSFLVTASWTTRCWYVSVSVVWPCCGS